MVAQLSSYALAQGPGAGCVTAQLQNLAPVRPELVLENKIRQHLESLGTYDPNRSPYNREFVADFKALFAQVKSPEEYLRDWRAIERLSQIHYVTKGDGYTSEYDYLSGLLLDLSRVDAVKPLVEFRGQFTPAQKKEFLAILNRIEVFNPDHYGDSWRQYAQAHRMALEPEAIFNYLKGITDRGEYARGFAEQHRAEHFHQGTITAVQSLPENIRLEAKDAALKGYRDTQAMGRLHLEDFGPDQNIHPEVFKDFLYDVKKERRNWETACRVLTEPEFQKFYGSLRGQTRIRVKDLNEAVKLYWKSIGFTDNGYTFEQVYATARRIQKGPLSRSLKDEDLLLYGSFPNGKARIGRSDVDVHPSVGLMKKYYKAFKDQKNSGTFADFRDRLDRKPAPPEAEKMSAQLLQTEREVAEVLNVKSYEPAELMTMVLLSPHDQAAKRFFAKEMLGQYNPISVRVTKTKIFLEVYDAYQTRNQLRLEILP